MCTICKFTLISANKCEECEKYFSLINNKCQNCGNMCLKCEKGKYLFVDRKYMSNL